MQRLFFSFFSFFFFNSVSIITNCFQAKICRRNSCGLKRLVIIQMVSLRINLLDHLKLKPFSKVEWLLYDFKYTTIVRVCVRACAPTRMCRCHRPVSFGAFSLEAGKTSEHRLTLFGNGGGRTCEGALQASPETVKRQTGRPPWRMRRSAALGTAPSASETRRPRHVAPP